MKNMLVSATAALALLGAAAATAPAQAQVGLQIGPGGVQLYDQNDRPSRRIVERRTIERRPVIVEDEPECRTVITRRTNQFGERVERRRRICE